MLVTVCLIVAVVLFICAAFDVPRTGWIGLAFFAGSFLVGRI